MPKRRVTSTKRQREQVKRDKQQRKAERRANRKVQQAGAADTPPDREPYGNDAP
ncbi:MAG TPA: hypothetical protein VL284_05250 [Thermoanaerobaculia bacterium]|nr:hypothetical protein [Thermoanaerobaculia bacterium]